MEDLYIKVQSKIKMFLGICNAKGCHKKAIANINIKEVNIKRCLCREHLDNFKKFNVTGEIKEK